MSINLPVLKKKNITNHYKNAKINTCQIQQTSKTLKFQLTNNSTLTAQNQFWAVKTDLWYPYYLCKRVR